MFLIILKKYYNVHKYNLQQIDLKLKCSKLSTLKGPLWKNIHIDEYFFHAGMIFVLKN